MGGLVTLCIQENGETRSGVVGTWVLDIVFNLRFRAKDKRFLNKVKKDDLLKDLKSCGDIEPYDYGLVFLNFDEKNILSMQSFCSPVRFSIQQTKTSSRNDPYSEYEELAWLLKKNRPQVITWNDDLLSVPEDLKTPSEFIQWAVKEASISNKAKDWKSEPKSVLRIDDWKIRDLPFNPEAMKEVYETLIKSGHITFDQDLRKWDECFFAICKDEPESLYLPSNVRRLMIAQGEHDLFSTESQSGKNVLQRRL